MKELSVREGWKGKIGKRKGKRKGEDYLGGWKGKRKGGRVGSWESMNGLVVNDFRFLSNEEIYIHKSIAFSI